MFTNDDNDRKIDFSLLDPSRDEERWEARIAAIAERAMAQRRPSVTGQLHGWARPVLAFAAAIALLTSGAAIALGRPPAAPAQQPADALVEWATNDRVPPVTEVLATFGGDDGR